MTASVLPISGATRTRVSLPPSGQAVRDTEITPPRVLFVDGEPALRATCARVLALEGCEVLASGDGAEALELLARRAFDIAFVDLQVPHANARALMRAILDKNPRAFVVLMTDDIASVDGIAPLREGAWDILAKPFSAVQLQLLAARAARAVHGERARTSGSSPALQLHDGSGAPCQVLGKSPAFRHALELAAKVAATNASVFITGESGSGKELVARYIHEQSKRASGPFVAVNCGAIPETLIESEMFGHRKGAFTGATREKPGLLETASGGTLFLDELIEMPTESQTKLLRVIQDGVVRRVGSEETDAVVNVRFISATNRNPAEAMANGALREDLFYRLRVVQIHVPPLRERPEDIGLLAEHFLMSAWREHHERRRPPVLSAAAIEALRAHPWRGNVRELRNVMEHVALLSDPGAEILPENLPLLDESDQAGDVRHALVAPSATEGAYHEARDRVIAEFEKQYVKAIVSRANGNVTRAARLAGVERATLYRMMDRHGLQRRPDPGSLRGPEERES